MKSFDFHPPHLDRMEGDDLVVALIERNFITASACSFRREAIDAVGAFDPSPMVRGSDDLDLWLRIAEAGYAAVRVDRPLAVYRERHNSVSKDSLMMFRNVRPVIEAAGARARSGSPVDRASRARLDALNGDIERLGSDALGERVRRGVLDRAAQAKRRVNRSRAWGPPPPELAEALPELSRP